MPIIDPDSRLGLLYEFSCIHLFLFYIFQVKARADWRVTKETYN